jgi:hypothetical protein
MVSAMTVLSMASDSDGESPIREVVTCVTASVTWLLTVFPSIIDASLGRVLNRIK